MTSNSPTAPSSGHPQRADLHHHPGSAVLFPTLGVPTGALDAIHHLRRSADRAAMMPRRRRTRAQNRARYIATERQRNHPARPTVSSGLAPPANDDDPPPFWAGLRR
jgi:hypothetical protein